MKTLLRVLAVAMAALFTVDAASAATANSTATVKVTIGRRSERVAVEAERMTRYMTMVFDLTARQESKLYYLNLEWADRCDLYTDRVDLDIIADRWYYEYTRDLDVILNNRQMRMWRNRYGSRYGDYNRPRTSISINIGARPHVHIGSGHNHSHSAPHTAPHTEPHTAPHTEPHTAPHTEPHTAPHKGNVGIGSNRPSNNRGNVGNGGNRPSNNKGNVGNGGNRPSNNKGSYRSSSSSNRGSNNATRNGGSTRSSNSSNNSNNSRDKGTSSRGR